MKIFNGRQLSFLQGWFKFIYSFSGLLQVKQTQRRAHDVGSSVTLELYPEGADAGDTYFTGTVIVTGKSVTSSFDGMVEVSFTATVLVALLKQPSSLGIGGNMSKF